MKVSAIEVQLSSGAIAITSFHFSRAWGVLEKSKAPRYCGSEIGLSQSKWIVGRLLELCRKATPRCGLWRCIRYSGWNFSLDCFCLGFEVGLWIEMVMALNLSAVGAKVRHC